MNKTFKITVSGQVQGVGFRPYVFKTAQKFHLKGTVSNNEEGVVIYVSGKLAEIEIFYKTIIKSPPPVSKIKKCDCKEVSLQQFADFQIIPSSKKGKLNVALTPDFAICTNCRKEIKNRKNRRYLYAFTTCVNCGPRWAITNKFPFERMNTSIQYNNMCQSCLAEYINPINRRFHSQTNTCKTCGFSVFLTDNSGIIFSDDIENVFKKATKLLKENKILAIKNTSGYLLCCNAESKEAVQQLRKRKNRPTKPLAVLFPSLKFLQKELSLNKEQINSLKSTERPIQIVSLKNYQGKIALHEVAPNLNQLGVILPYSGILELLANNLDIPIVATSGNIHGSPIVSNNEDALKKLSHVADYFLQHNLTINHSQDDSVLKFSNKFAVEVLFRRSRGYAPNYLGVHLKTQEKILAMGAHLKSTISFLPNEQLYISEYLGNLDNFDVFNRFTQTVNNFIDLFEQVPEVILVDKHPAYQSTLFGKELVVKYQAKQVDIQHHKAHFAAILGEHNLFDKRVLGVVFDGTGYGEDTNIWGGEFFKYESHTIERINHFTYFNWLLGDKMAKEPRISLLSLASEEMQSLLKTKFTFNELKTYQSLLKNNHLKTSSVGRLFDAVASLLQLTDYNNYEGEAAILLENSVTNYNLKTCKSYLNSTVNGIDSRELLRNLYIDLQNGFSKESCVVNFLYTLAKTVLNEAISNRFEYVAFSGGVFQNTTLIDMLVELAQNKIKLYFHKDLSPNDENCSFGQLMYYLNIKK